VVIGRDCVSSVDAQEEPQMPQFDPQLIQVMRDALETVMTKVPVEHATPAVKAYLAECILKAAAQGQTTFDGLVATAADQIHTILSLLT
jgi:hypothetical protein